MAFSDVTYDNMKSHKKPGFHPLFKRYTFRKTTEVIRIFLRVKTEEIGKRNSEFFFSSLNSEFFDIESVFVSF